MSLNNSGVLSMFLEGSRAESHTGSLISDGVHLIRYGTTLGQWDGGYLYLNRTYYSPSTSRIQNDLLTKAERIVPAEKLVKMTENFQEGIKELVL